MFPLKYCIHSSSSSLPLKVIEHKAYDHKADVFSFAIVLWELLTAKVATQLPARFPFFHDQDQQPSYYLRVIRRLPGG